jgi:hypothetical protein
MFGCGGVNTIAVIGEDLRRAVLETFVQGAREGAGPEAVFDGIISKGPRQGQGKGAVVDSRALAIGRIDLGNVTGVVRFGTGIQVLAVVCQIAPAPETHIAGRLRIGIDQRAVGCDLVEPGIREAAGRGNPVVRPIEIAAYMCTLSGNRIESQGPVDIAQPALGSHGVGKRRERKIFFMDLSCACVS